MTIWKFPFAIGDEIAIKMPEDATLLSVAMQDGTPYLWAAVDETAPEELRKIQIRGTGQPLGTVSVAKYIGTIHLDINGPLVFHVFDGGVEPFKEAE
jgi:hypothetical protein